MTERYYLLCFETSRHLEIDKTKQRVKKLTQVTANRALSNRTRVFKPLFKCSSSIICKGRDNAARLTAVAVKWYEVQYNELLSF